MKLKEESENIDLKLNIHKTKIMATSPITSWQIDGETEERVTLFLGAPKSLQMVTEAIKLKSLGSFLPTKNFKILQNLSATQSSCKEK